MNYCLNPHCQQPENTDLEKYCVHCGHKLVLHDRYQIMKPIGAGNFGRTFLAIDRERCDSHCVIKQFHPQTIHQVNYEKAAELFAREAEQLCALGDHPQIPALLAYFSEDAQLYLIQQLIPGENLRQVLEEVGAFSEVLIWQLLINLLPVLAYIHEHQIIHRDIKPENIILCQGQSSQSLPGKTSFRFSQKIPKITAKFLLQLVKNYQKNLNNSDHQQPHFILIDFGVAKNISHLLDPQKATMTGTLGYAPIEQLRGGMVSPASDIYSLGMTCLNLLTNLLPEDLFDSLTGDLIWRQRLAEQGKVISDKLAKILDKMLEDLVKYRYHTVDEIWQDIFDFDHSNSQLSQKIYKSRQGQWHKSHESSINHTVVHQVFRALSNLHHINHSVDHNSHQPHHHQTNLIPVKNPPRFRQKSRCIHIIEAHSALINSLDIGPQGLLLVSGSDDKTIKLWNVQTGQLLHRFTGHQGEVGTVAISPDGRRLVSGSSDRTIMAWNMEQKSLCETFYSHAGSPYSHNQGGINTVAFSPDGKIISSGGGDRTIKIWNPRNGQLLYQVSEHLETVLCVNYANRYHNIFSSIVKSLHYEYRPLIFASGAADGLIKIWRFGSLQSLSTLKGHSQAVHTIDFHPQENFIASGGSDRTIKLWRLDNGKLMRNFVAHQDAVLSVKISPDGQLLASGSQDGTVKIWHLNSGELLESLAGTFPVVFAPDGQTLITGGEIGKILVWQLPVYGAG
jgi:WD40 repeat protein